LFPCEGYEFDTGDNTFSVPNGRGRFSCSYWSCNCVPCIQYRQGWL